MFHSWFSSTYSFLAFVLCMNSWNFTLLLYILMFSETQEGALLISEALSLHISPPNTLFWQFQLSLPPSVLLSLQFNKTAGLFLPTSKLCSLEIVSRRKARAFPGVLSFVFLLSVMDHSYLVIIVQCLKTCI